jgi:hypothetical protein
VHRSSVFIFVAIFLLHGTGFKSATYCNIMIRRAWCKLFSRRLVFSYSPRRECVVLYGVSSPFFIFLNTMIHNSPACSRKKDAVI